MENDGCTFWFDQWFGTDVRYCCDAHDLAFAVGTSPQEFLQANLELLRCGLGAGVPLWAALAFIGVMSPVGAFLFFFGKKSPKA